MAEDIDGTLLAGKALLARVDAYLRDNESLLRAVKVSLVEGRLARVLAMRCRAIEQTADFLADKVKVGVLAHQHDVVLVIGNVILLGGDVSHLKRHDARGREIDITALRQTIEVKNGIDISPRDVPRLVDEHFGELVASASSKHAWWLCYFARRPAPKGKIGEVCMYYLVIIEIPVARVVACGGEACRVAVGDEAMRLADEIEKKVVAEDEVDEGFLVPVKNVWIVDKLRAELAASKNELEAKDKALEAKDKALEAKDKALAAKDKALAASKKEIERLKQQLSKQ
ncbi:MAG: hypothetical protein GYA24_20030 [Candidatus Lokiarchaeota archaeon]|nr:hypothetical protein [Candidatus Lokiarchaeota archaeon]